MTEFAYFMTGVSVFAVLRLGADLYHNWKLRRDLRRGWDRMSRISFDKQVAVEPIELPPIPPLPSTAKDKN